MAAAATGDQKEKNYKIVEIPPAEEAKFFTKAVEHIHKKVRASVDATGTAAHRSAASAQRSPGGKDSAQRSAEQMQEMFLGERGGMISATMSWEARDWVQKELCHTEKRYDKTRQYKAGSRMKNADTLSHCIRAEDQAVDAMLSATPARPAPLFGNGQSAIQWYAHWMTDATELPKTYNKGNRPSWYSAEITAYVGWKEDRNYCGVPQACHFYAVY